MSMIPEYIREPFHVGETIRGHETIAIPADVYGSIESFCQECEIAPESAEEVTGMWWARLQMSGYLDASEWSGPFESESKAREAISDMYDCDPDTGEDLDAKRERMLAANSGYHDCPCRDCFEIAIGCDDDGAPHLCHACQSADCNASGGGSECSVEPCDDDDDAHEGK